MDSASIQFVAFGLAAALVSNFSRTRAWRSVVLFTASMLFLVLAQLGSSPVLFLPLAGFLLIGYAGLLLIEHGWSKAFVVSLFCVLLAYFWLKKYTFLPEAIFLRSPYFTLGLSYILFRVLHLLIEAKDNHEQQRLGIGKYLLYTLNFTTFVSGPIQRYDDFAADQFAEQPIQLRPRVIGLQLERIIRGFFKVNVLAMIFDVMHADALTQLSEPLPLGLRCYAAFRLAILYPLFLYCNFSGYIDIVIALARLMRVRLPENFDRPFSASSFLDFWNRWHITLSTWLKTYVYNPLLIVQMRLISSPAAEPFLGVVSFFITFFLIGIWHGRTSEFIVFGVLQGGGVAINKLWQLGLTKGLGRKGYKALANDPIYTAFGRGLTFTWFAFTLFWFWANWQQIGRMYASLGFTKWLVIWAVVWVFSTLILWLYEQARSALLSVKLAGEPVFNNRYALVIYASTLGLVSVILTVLMNQAAPGIVYKAF